MSSKTTFKRIALVAVAALTGGLLSIVATPAANAAGLQEIATSISVGTIPAARAGVTVKIPVVINLPSTMADTDTFVVGVKLLTAPSTSALATVAANASNPSGFTATTTNAAGAILDLTTASSGSGSYGTFTGALYSNTGNATASAVYNLGSSDSTGQVTLRVSFTPDVSGAYTILFSTPTGVLTTAQIADYTASTSDTSTAFSVSTATSPTKFTLTNLTGAPGALAASVVPGAIVKLALDAPLGSGETVVVTTTGSSTLIDDETSNSGATLTSLTITSSTCSTTSCYFRVDDIASETVTVTATAGGLIAASGVTGSLGVTFKVSTVSAGVTASKTGATTTTNAALVTASTTTTPSSSLATYITGAKTQTLIASLTAANTAAVYSHWLVKDTSGTVTGIANATYTNTMSFAAASLAAAESSKTFSADLTPTGVTGSLSYKYYSATLYPGSAITIGGATPAASTMTITNDTRRVVAASTNVIVATLTDQFDNAVSNASVTITVAGRNGATSSSTIVTNSSGEVSYSLTDAGTVGTTDTITFTSGSATASATLTYGSTTVTTLDILGPNDTAANTPDTTVTFAERTGINAAKGGATGTKATVTVTAKDANGVVMAGVPVSFSVAGTTAAVLSTTKTVYTGAAGTASTSVYAWATGSYVVTATAGGKTSTTTVYFGQTTPTYSRTITAAVSGGTVTATVKDRYGNAVPNVTVWATKTGTGYFGSGSSSTSGTTGEAGTVDFYVNGSASVTVSLGSSTAADANYGQSGSALGYVKQGDGATPAAVTASAAGDAATAETGVGAAYAAAGINSATVSVEAGVTAAETAADAAAEATDAANAATDAANAAAEAADAATAAAQDAADAVAALSAQVATLISGLKAQLTALTNLVIKIQKKVKA
jgi:hypothetical protein